jgi:PLP dependent protein
VHQRVVTVAACTVGAVGFWYAQAMNSSIAQNLAQVQTQIQGACLAAGRPAGCVQLLAVSKTWGPDAVRAAHAAGQTAFGENYIQEAVDKIADLHDLPLVWHCIGPIQSNKTRLVAEHFDWAHSIDRLKIAQRLSEQRPEHLPPMQVCIQVNVDGGETKSGVSPQDLPAMAQAVASLPRLQLRGLMTIPEPAETEAQMRAVHRQSKDLFDSLRTQGLPLDTLSMGMSADMNAAIAEGSTMVRVGTAIFGKR